MRRWSITRLSIVLAGLGFAACSGKDDDPGGTRAAGSGATGSESDSQTGGADSGAGGAEVGLGGDNSGLGGVGSGSGGADSGSGGTDSGSGGTDSGSGGMGGIASSGGSLCGVGTAPLPDTGQSTCFDDEDPASCPAVGDPWFGQDAQFAGSQRAYTVNGDGTVIDDVTGLLWQQGGPATLVEWNEAVTFCESLELGARTDWRLPDARELYGLVHFGAESPPIDVATYPEAQAFYYWTGSVNSFDSANAWQILFIDGQLESRSKASAAYVRCVAGSTSPSSSFDDQGDQTVCDELTGLLWEQQSEAAAKGTHTWSGALARCEGIVHAGYDDWRLPNVRELLSLFDHALINPAVDQTAFPEIQLDSYWSSTTVFGASSAAWIVSARNGGVVPGSKAGSAAQRHVICVR